MKNLFISNMNKKDVESFTCDLGLLLRRKLNRVFRRLCKVFTNAHIIMPEQPIAVSDEDYFADLASGSNTYCPFDVKKGKNNIVVERYPKLDKDESYIFVCNHTCPEDIETVLSVLDRNVYVVMGSVELLKYDPEMYLLWLNGMIPFDIMDSRERKELMPKMSRVLQTNSILIFPEGSHNYHANKSILPLFDGPVNLALQTNKKIVIVTLIKDKENEMAYIDVSNPVDVRSFNIVNTGNDKQYVNSLTACIRDKMATAAFHIVSRHIEPLKRSQHNDIENEFHAIYIEEAFSALKWKNDVFEAEYLVKKPAAERDYEEVIHTLSNLRLSPKTIRQTGLDSREYILKEIELQRQNVAGYMREYWKGI